MGFCVAGFDSFVFESGSVEESGPGLDVWSSFEECASFAFGHAAPDAEFDSVIESVGEAFRADWAAHADLFGLVLFRALYEKRVGVLGSAGAVLGPESVTETEFHFRPPISHMSGHTTHSGYLGCSLGDSMCLSLSWLDP